MFDKLVRMNCFSRNKILKNIARNLLEKLYCCEINCIEIDKSILFAHHARGSIIIASKICENVVIADGAKILGPIIIGENSFVTAGAIVTKDTPANSIAYGVNQLKAKNTNYDFVYNSNIIKFEKIIEVNKKLIEIFNEKNN